MACRISTFLCVGRMTLRRAPFKREKKEYHAIAVYIHIVCHLMSRFRVMYAVRFEKLPVDHDGFLYVFHAHR